MHVILEDVFINIEYLLAVHDKMFSDHCAPPKLANGTVTPYKPTGYSPGESIELSCLPGFFLTGSEYAECGNDNHWSIGTPTCVCMFNICL